MFVTACMPMHGVLPTPLPTWRSSGLLLLEVYCRAGGRGCCGPARLCVLGGHGPGALSSRSGGGGLVLLQRTVQCFANHLRRHVTWSSYRRMCVSMHGGSPHA